MGVMVTVLIFMGGWEFAGFQFSGRGGESAE